MKPFSCIDAIAALLTYFPFKSSVNMRTIFLHNVADALGSIGAIVASTHNDLFDWWFIDPIETLGIAACILWLSLLEPGSVIHEITRSFAPPSG